MYRTIILCLSACLLCSTLCAESIRIDPLRIERMQDTARREWLVFEVMIELEDDPDPDNYPGWSVLPRVQVMLDLAWLNPDDRTNPKTGQPKALQFFSSDVTLTALVPRRPTPVRFFLPPEMLHNWKMPDRPYAYWVRVHTAGVMDGLWAEHRSAQIEDDERARRFREMGRSERERNRGILRPEADTPFAVLARDKNTPTTIAPRSEKR